MDGNELEGKDINIEIVNYRGVPIVKIRGTIDILSHCKLEDVTNQIEMAPLIIIDMTEVVHFESIGVHWLLKWRDRHGGIVLFVAVSDSVKRVLQITGLLPLFPVFENMESAHDAIDRIAKIVSSE